MMQIEHSHATHPLMPTSVSRAKLVGFRRMAPQPPASVLPVFVDASSVDESALLYQRIDNAGNVSEFLADPNLRQEHLIAAGGDSDKLDIKKGDRAIHAYEVEPAEVLLGEKGRFKELLQELLSKKELSDAPFAALEMAQFVENFEMEQAYATLCAEDLLQHSAKLALTWASGTNLSPKARKSALAVAKSQNPSRKARSATGSVKVGASFGRIWLQVKNRLRDSIGEDVYKSWFERMNLEDVQQESVRLSVPTRFLRSWIEAQYGERVLSAWQAERPEVHRIDLTVRSPAEAVAPAEARPPRAAEQLTRELPAFGKTHISVKHDVLGGSLLDPRLTFESFVIGRSNTLAHSAARQVAGGTRNDATIFNPLYVHGNPGVGKTHLLQAITWAGNADGNRKVLYLTAEKFMYGFVTALKTRTALTFKEALRGIDVLVVDDLQFLQGKSTQVEFRHTLNALIDAGKQVVIAADRPPSDLEGLDDRLRSRFAGGLIVEMGQINKQLRYLILKSRVSAVRALRPSFEVPDEVLDYLAHTITRNGRDLEGAINRLLASSKLDHERVTLEMAEREVRNLFRIQQSTQIEIEDVQRVVAEQCNISRSDLSSSRRSPDVVRARQVAMYLAKTLTLHSLTEIGRHFGGREHTSVLHAVRTIETLIPRDRHLSDLIQSCTEQVLELPRQIKIEDVQRVVARQYSVSRSDLLSSRRTANVVRPRQIAMYLAKTLTLRSLPEIGRRFGGRDPTTVLHAVRKIEALVARDTALSEEVESLKRQLQE